MAVTIRDVAALAGVSPSTVSRTCRNNPSISEETKERVRRAAKQLGYAMEGISTPATRTVGVILPPSAREVYENPFYLEMIRGINQFCNAHQYVSTIVTGRDNDEILSAVRLLVSSGAADAFILLYSRQLTPMRTKRSISTTTTFWPGRRRLNISSAGDIGASPIWAATTPISLPPTESAAISPPLRWRVCR